MWKDGGGGAKLCETRVKCLTIQKTIQNFSRRSSRVCLAALRVPLLLPSPSSPPSPLHATQLQLHCELNCNEAHAAAAKYENEKQKCVLHGIVQRGDKGRRSRIRNSSQEMAINSYVCCSDTLQTVLMTTPSPRRVSNYF